jgi:hypothetical protein
MVARRAAERRKPPENKVVAILSTEEPVYRRHAGAAVLAPHPEGDRAGRDSALGDHSAQGVGGDDGNRTRVRGFADRSLNHSGTSPPVASTGCPGSIRTTVNGSKVRCPATRRRGTRSGPTLAGRPWRNQPDKKNGAEDGTRTRDPHLGKVMLYQLSHFRPLVCPIVPPNRRSGWCRGPGSNWRHLDFQSSALPTELPRLAGSSGTAERIPMGLCGRNRYRSRGSSRSSSSRIGMSYEPMGGRSGFKVRRASTTTPGRRAQSWNPRR